MEGSAAHLPVESGSDPVHGYREVQENPPWTIAVSNASISNVWAVGWLHSLQYVAAQHKDVIKQLIVTDANDDSNKQVADIQDLLQRKPDLLIVRPATAQALDPAVTRAMKSGVPVVLSDRSITSDNYLSLINADDWSLGRHMAQWIAETLKGKGNIVMIAGIAGASPAENRIKAAHEVFDTYPGIKILDLQYTDWSPAKGKTVMAALIQKYGKQINAVWSDHGLEGSGAIEAFVDAGYKDGEIPPITCADLNACLTLAVKHKVPALNFDYPPKMGGVSLEVALSVLQGLPVPKHYVISSDISISKGLRNAFGARRPLARRLRADEQAGRLHRLDRHPELRSEDIQDRVVALERKCRDGRRGRPSRRSGAQCGSCGQPSTDLARCAGVWRTAC